jgi:osmoprotectant transport system substrate-binding protein
MKFRFLALAGVAVAASLALSACGSSSNDGGSGGNTSASATSDTGSGSGTAPATTSSSGGGATIGSKFIFGGPPEFATRRLDPLQKAYGFTFEKFTPLDTGGPATVTALKNGQVDAADIFTTDPAIKANNFVVLEDPKSFFGAQNVVPLISKTKATTGVKQVLNFLDAKLTSEVLIDLRTKVEVNKEDASKAAEDWLKTLAASQPPAGLNKGVTLTVGSANFPENEILADIYIKALQATGATVKSKLNIGSREKYFPGLKDGSIDLIPEYIGSILSYLDKNATASTVADVEKALTPLLPSNLEILDPAPAQDNDAVVVTKANADKYGLRSIADLAKTG